MTTIAVITGANKGIGFEAARQLGKTGMTILVGARDLAKGEDAAAKLRAEGIQAHALEMDVAQESSVKKAAQAVTGNFGWIDVLVNNAGIAPDMHAGTAPVDLDEAMLREVFETNTFGPFRVTKAFLPLLRRSRRARVINVTSRLGSLAMLTDPASGIYDVNFAAYNASKTALNAITVALAKDLVADRISVNAVCPGWVKTDMGGPEAPRSVEQGARAIVALALSGNPPTGTYTNENGPLPW